jgi:hypothetical protein
MWYIKHFKSFASQSRWIERNRHRCQITILFVNNGYAIEYRVLRQIGG